MSNYSKYREKVLNVVREADMPLGIETIRKKAGIKIWETSKAILLELVIQGKISGMKTGKSWIFWIDKESKRMVIGKPSSENQVKN